MDNPNCNIKRSKGQHLTYEERVEIEIRLKDGWSLDACVGFAKNNNLFDKAEMVCTKTLYNYVDACLMNITKMDLPEKLSRNTKTKKVRENKKNLGNSIEERPKKWNYEKNSVIGKSTV